MDKKVCIITGANSGIGKQAAIQMAQAGLHVVMACRSANRGQSALKEVKELSGSESVELILLDLSLMASTKEFAEVIKSKYDHIDVLIHNAAVFDISQKEVKLTSEGYEQVWMTNHVNVVYLTQLLMDLLKVSEAGRIITVSSKGLLANPFLKVDLKDPEFKSRKFSMSKAYYQSKRAQVMYTLYLAKELVDTNITVNCVRVTAVQVDMSRHQDISAFMKWVYAQKSKQSLTPEQMARTYTYLATSDDVAGKSGGYYDENNCLVNTSSYESEAENIANVMQLTQTYLD